MSKVILASLDLTTGDMNTVKLDTDHYFGISACLLFLDSDNLLVGGTHSVDKLKEEDGYYRPSIFHIDTSKRRDMQYKAIY